jgi:hypothetical protein
MHHIALCTPCIALFNCGKFLHIRIDHAEPESEFSSGASPMGVWWFTNVK